MSTAKVSKASNQDCNFFSQTRESLTTDRKSDIYLIINFKYAGCICMRLMLRPMQTDATLLANNTQHCRAKHVASVCMEPQQCWHLLALVAYSLKQVKLLGPCKRTQHCWPKTSNNTLNVVTCCVRLHRPLKRLES